MLLTTPDVMRLRLGFETEDSELTFDPTTGSVWYHPYGTDAPKLFEGKWPEIMELYEEADPDELDLINQASYGDTASLDILLRGMG